MICSLFNFCPQSAQSRRHEGALVGLAPQAKLQTPQIETSVEFVFSFRISSPTAQTQSRTIENFLATVLSLLLIHLLSTCPFLPKWKKSLNTYVRSGAQNMCVSKCLLLGEQQYSILFEILPLKEQNDFCNRDFVTDHRFWMVLRSGEFPGQSSTIFVSWKPSSLL